jgi:large subunit ribosomal protein L18
MERNKGIIMPKSNPKIATRLRRKLHIRKRIHGTETRPRLSIFRSAKHIYGQIINDDTQETICSAGTTSQDFSKYGGNKLAAEELGKIIAAKALEKGVKTVIFDRNGFLYHGRVKSFADGARSGGLKF